MPRTRSVKGCSPRPRKISDNCINSQRTTDSRYRAWVLVRLYTKETEIWLRGGHDGCHFHSQWEIPNRRCVAANAVAMGFARLAGYDRHEIRLRDGPLRLLHRTSERPAHPLLR